MASLRPLVCDSRLAAYKSASELWRRALPKLNRAATIPIDEHAHFKADAWAFVSLIQDYFLEASISPKLHMLFAHSWQFMGTWGSTRLYGEQAIESWHGFFNQHAPRFTAETALLSCRKLVQAMALSCVSSDALRRSKARICKLRAGPSLPLRSECRRLRQNKSWKRDFLATMKKRLEDRGKRAADQFVVSNRVIQTFSKSRRFLSPMGSCGNSDRLRPLPGLNRCLGYCVRPSQFRRKLSR